MFSFSQLQSSMGVKDRNVAAEEKTELCKTQATTCDYIDDSTTSHTLHSNQYQMSKHIWEQNLRGTTWTLTRGICLVGQGQDCNLSQIRDDCGMGSRPKEPSSNIKCVTTWALMSLTIL